MNSTVKSERYKKIVLILDQLGLDPNHAHVLMTYNPSLNAPYHNSEHCFTVAINSYKAAQYYNLPSEQTTTLFLAALYHDYDHSADPTVNDVLNIGRAITGLAKWLLEFEEEKWLFQASDILRGTVYPHHLFVGERDFLQQIICDADALQWLEEDAEDFMVGLSTEKNCIVDHQTTYRFIAEHEFFTNFGIDAQKEYLTTVL